MKFEIKNRWSGAIVFSYELTAEWAGKSYALQLGFVIKKAIEARADLSRANLSDANLSDANLSDANLSGAYLSRADLSRADLSGADLSDANLSGAYLSRANLSDAYLSGANLSRADLSGANLSGANLSGADLSDANLSGADLRPIRADFYDVLAWAPAEVPALIDALKNGRVDGSTYEGACACLVGTIANVRGIDYSSLEHDAGRPIERFFAAIRKGDTPDTNQFSAVALDWAQSWLDMMRAAFATKPV